MKGVYDGVDFGGRDIVKERESDESGTEVFGMWQG